MPQLVRGFGRSDSGSPRRVSVATVGLLYGLFTWPKRCQNDVAKTGSEEIGVANSEVSALAVDVSCQTPIAQVEVPMDVVLEAQLVEFFRVGFGLKTGYQLTQKFGNSM